MRKQRETADKCWEVEVGFVTSQAEVISRSHHASRKILLITQLIRGAFHLASFFFLCRRRSVTP